MNLPQDIGARLARTYGLDPGLCLGPGLEHAVDDGRREAGLPSVDAYFDRLRMSSEAFSAFAHALLIPESWFFRDRAPFLFLKEWVQDTWLPGHPDSQLRVLSLPCATGQEPYSIAITLIEAGLPPERVHILAGDLSPQLLEQAKDGRYRNMAFRGADFCPREPYFEDEAEGLIRVREHIREQVTFKVLNLLEPIGYLGSGPFDVIFCRNVLIYFDTAGRRATIKGLEQSLAPDGLLCVGHADALGRITEDFQRVGQPGAFCYHRKPKVIEEVPKSESKALPRKAKPFFKPAPALPKARLPTAAPKPQPEETKPPVSGFAQARQLADAGKLVEAEKLCRTELEKAPGSVEVLYLLSELLLAQKKIPDGESLLRRVVYLDPNHSDALFRLALLAEQRGDDREAANWRRRATKHQLPTPNLS